MAKLADPLSYISEWTAVVSCMNRPKWLREAEFLLLAVLCAAVLMLTSGNMCHRSIQRVRESVLKQDLQTMRMAIDDYTVSEGRPPHSLQDLVDKSYLREIPANPFTGKKD
jgi:general secretion pathway protein G